MDLKKLLARLRAKIEQVSSKIGDEDIAKINSVLDDIDEGAGSLQQKLARTESESIERKETIRDLQKSIDAKDTEISTLKKRPDPAELEQKITTLTEKNSKLMKGQRDSFTTKFQTISKHPNFDKVKSFYKLPEADKDGKYDLSKMEDEDLEFNIGKLQEHEAAELFGKVEKPGVDGSPRIEHPAGGEKPGEIKSEEDLQSQIDKGFSELG